MSESTMEVSDDALKLLVAEHGVRGTARLLGMDERATDTFRQRVTRGKWLADPHIAALRAKSDTPLRGLPAAPVVAKLSPTAALHAELTAHGGRSRVAIARTVTKAAEHFETLDAPSIIADAGNLKSIAQTADLIHGWKEQAPQVKIRLDVLNGNSEPVVEVQSEVVNTSWDEDSVDPLDEY